MYQNPGARPGVARPSETGSRAIPKRTRLFAKIECGEASSIALVVGCLNLLVDRLCIPNGGGFQVQTRI